MKDTVKDRAVKIAQEEVGEACGEIGLQATLKILKAIERAFDEGFEEGMVILRRRQTRREIVLIDADTRVVAIEK